MTTSERAPLIILKFIKLPEVSPSNWNESSLRFALLDFCLPISLKELKVNVKVSLRDENYY